MDSITRHIMKKGILLSFDKFQGEEDFYHMHQIIKDVLKPEDSGFSVDSMCIGGYFIKDGILVRTSSESPVDSLSFYYEPEKTGKETEDLILNWAVQVAKRMQLSYLEYRRGLYD